MSSIDEKRVHGANTEAAALFVASAIGLVRVAVVGERVGTVELVHQCDARDLAVSESGVAVATDEDVLAFADETTEETGFGPAVAVGVDDALLAARPDGTVARRMDDGWTDCGAVDGVSAIDGDLLGATGGVYRLAGDELSYAGLDDVRDVAARPPHAASAAGLYRLGNGWLAEHEGTFSVVATDPTTDRAHAATAERLYERADGAWRAIGETETPVVGVAYADSVYAVTADGTLLAEADDGWREHPLGMGETRAVVARPDRKPV